MNPTVHEELLPSISHLLKRAGALGRSESAEVVTRVAEIPVFQTEAWRRSIAEFLRWSGSTLKVGGGLSVFELLLAHGRVGAFTLDRAFREHLIARGGSYDQARANLEAVRTVASMAAYWLREIDWDLSDAEPLVAEDFSSSAPASAAAPAESPRFGGVAGATSEPVPVAVADARTAKESASSFPAAPAPAPFPGPRGLSGSEPVPDLATPLFRNDPTVRSLWKPPARRDAREPPHPMSVRPARPREPEV